MERLVLHNDAGLEMSVVDVGARVERLLVPAGDGVRRDALLTSSTAAGLPLPNYLNSAVGRYANRIAGGCFEVGGQVVRLARNDRGNNLHGGPVGFDRRRWRVTEHSPTRVDLALTSDEGDQGFPGRLDVRLSYELEGSTVRSTWHATTDRTTVLNPTTHPYFTLEPAGSPVTFLDATLEVVTDGWLPTDATAIPLGCVKPVPGTVMDLRRPRCIGDVLSGLEGFELDHSFSVGGSGFRRVASLESSDGLLRLDLHSDRPGVQVCTDNAPAGWSQDWVPRAVALEPQHHPDSPHRPGWPTTVLVPGEVFRSVCEWRFTAQATGGHERHRRPTA